MSAESQHLLIGRPRGISGYVPRQWCCVCGKAATKDDTYTKCIEVSCLNLCHFTCLGNETEFSCFQAQALRTQFGITDPVSLVSVDNTTEDEIVSLPSHDEETAAHLMQLSKEELIKTVIQLQNQVSKQNNIIRSQKSQRDLMVSKRVVFEEALSLIDNIVATDYYNEDCTVSTSSTSAYSHKIDSDWKVICENSEYWNTWWRSEKPKQLRKLPKTQVVPQPSHPAPGNANENISKNQPQNPSKKKFPQKTNGVPSLFCKICRRKGHIESSCYKNKNCDYCKKRGHSFDRCRKREADLKRNQKCDFCSRKGHESGTCYLRAAEVRQEQILRTVLEEQRNQNTNLLKTLHTQNSVYHIPPAHQISPWIQQNRNWNQYMPQTSYGAQTFQAR